MVLDLQSRPHSPSEAGHKTRPLAFVTQRVTATLIADPVPLSWRSAADSGSALIDR